MTKLAESGRSAGAPENPFVIRPFAWDADLPASVRLRNETDAVDQTDTATTEAEQRVRLTSPDHDPARDRWVVEEPGRPDRLIAEGVAWKGTNAPDAWLGLTVHPDWRRRGLGHALLPRLIARAREQGAQYVTSGTNERVPAGPAFLQAHGFRPTTTWYDMQTPRHLDVSEPQVPQGYRIRPYSEVSDLDALLVALNRGFIGHWGHHDETPEDIAHWLQAPITRPDGIFLAFGPAGDVAGLSWNEINPERSARRGVPTGYVDSLAVVPEHRRQGLGRALLLTGMRWMRDNGMEQYELGAWGENEMALPLYFGVGYDVAQRGQEFRWDFPDSALGDAKR